jgi:acetolactate synthase-1/2/3 large subunit
MSGRTGAELLCGALEASGARVVFGVPGTQNVELFEALRRSRLRTVLATSELTAGFMAGAYARVTGNVGVVITIPGPGFMFALPGLAEARLDSAAVLHVTGAPATQPGRRFQLQALDQRGIAAPLVKAFREVSGVAELPVAVREAWTSAAGDEPGPVVLQVASEVLGTAAASVPSPAEESIEAPTPDLRGLVNRVRSARRPLLLVGQGALSAAPLVRGWIERGFVPVLTTPSGRGIVPEDHPLCLGFDPLRTELAAVNGVCDAADLILAIGCKLSHNGCVGFGLRLPADRLVHVDTSAEVLGANYAPSLAVCATAEHTLAALESVPAGRFAWDEAEITRWRRAIRALRRAELPEPHLGGAASGKAAAFFADLRRALPRDGIVVTDSGLHQILTRRYFDVLAPGGLLLPSDLQTMGFGVPAAVAAKLAAPDRAVTAIVGDGGFAVTGAELLTAAREGLALVVVVFDDGHLNQIRMQQLRDFGHAHAVDVGPLDVAAFAAGVGADYVPVADDIGQVLVAAHRAGRPAVVHVPVGDSAAVLRRRAASAIRSAARRVIGPRLIQWLRSLRGA